MVKYCGLEILNRIKWKNRMTKRGRINIKQTELLEEHRGEEDKMDNEVFRNIYFYKDWIASRLVIMAGGITFNFSTWCFCFYSFCETKRCDSHGSWHVNASETTFSAVPLKTNSSGAVVLVVLQTETEVNSPNTTTAKNKLYVKVTGDHDFSEWISKYIWRSEAYIAYVLQ